MFKWVAEFKRGVKMLLMKIVVDNQVKLVIQSSWQLEHSFEKIDEFQLEILLLLRKLDMGHVKN